MEMTQDVLKKAIKERHSVRTYIEKPIDAAVVEELEKAIAAANEEGNLHLQFVKEAGNTCNKLFNKKAGLGTAPSVIACIGPDDKTLDERIGYYGEKIVLLAQALGLNTCWVGTFSKSECNATVNAGEKFPIVIAIGYGATSGNVRKSKEREDVTDAKTEMPDWFCEGVDAALLAPTAINQQRFKIKLNPDGSVSITDRGGVLSLIDLGIVKCHFEIGSGKKL